MLSRDILGILLLCRKTVLIFKRLICIDATDTIAHRFLFCGGKKIKNKKYRNGWGSRAQIIVFHGRMDTEENIC
jgi:hypothetical protein